MNNTNQTEEMLIKHFREYPQLHLQDMFKFLYQSSFGCEHLLSDPSAAIAYIQKEAAACKPHTGEWAEALDGAYYRVHLDWVKDGLNAETLGKLFVLSAKPVENGREMLEEKLKVLSGLCAKGSLPFSNEEVQTAIEQWKAEGYPPCHHSDTFRNAYAPAYRLLKREFVPFLPLFADIDRRLKRNREEEVKSFGQEPQKQRGLQDGPTACNHITLAIEGGSAGGKTTLGNLLQQIYGCTVFHMDDFFLQLHQRTQKRLSEAGGNVDRERFLEEVLVPLKEQKPVNYRRFDCSTFTLGEPVTVNPTRLCVVEGAYSMHPELAGYYDMSVFLEVAPELQKKRIWKRNSPELAERFFREWIPMEQKYFEAFSVKERCDRVIPISE